MATKNYVQVDMFESTVFSVEKEWKLIELEEKQDKLRKGLFKRWKEQEEKIKKLSNEVRFLAGLLEGAIDKIEQLSLE